MSVNRVWVSMSSGADFGLTTEGQAKLPGALSIIIPMRFEDFDIWLTKGFWTIQENLTSIFALQVQFEGIMQQIHIKGGGPNEVVKTAEKIL